jgi:hypothetical protein
MITMKTLAKFGAFACLFALSVGTASANPIRLPDTLAEQPPASGPEGLVQVSAAEQAFTAYITGYSYWDNTPPGSAAIARPVIHQKAGGKGTYRDPITIAVGYRLVGGKAKLDFPAGTRFYLPHLQRYAIVEDICGDGPQPHLTGCARGKNGMPWLDIYVDGSRVGASAADACMYRLTGFHDIIMNPRDGYPVQAGPIAESGCGTSPSR